MDTLDQKWTGSKGAITKEKIAGKILVFNKQVVLYNRRIIHH